MASIQPRTSPRGIASRWQDEASKESSASIRGKIENWRTRWLKFGFAMPKYHWVDLPHLEHDVWRKDNVAVDVPGKGRLHLVKEKKLGLVKVPPYLVQDELRTDCKFVYKTTYSRVAGGPVVYAPPITEPQAPYPHAGGNSGPSGTAPRQRNLCIYIRGAPGGADYLWVRLLAVCFQGVPEWKLYQKRWDGQTLYVINHVDEFHFNSVSSNLELETRKKSDERGGHRTKAAPAPATAYRATTTTTTTKKTKKKTTTAK